MSEPLDLLLRDCLLPDGARVDLGCGDGRIVALSPPGALGPPGDARAARVIDVGGRLVTAGLVDAHIHLDKALLSSQAPSLEGSLAEAIRVTGAAKRGFTVDDIRARARVVLDLAVRSGTTAMRSHVEVDPIVGLKGLEALRPLRDECAPALELQLCAFAQEGIIQAPGTEALLARALREGADLVGGCPYNDTDPHAHVDTIFRLAREFGVDVDFHADFFDEPEHLHVRYICEQTVRLGWDGRVAVGHLNDLSALSPADQDAVIAARRNAEISGRTNVTFLAGDMKITLTPEGIVDGAGSLVAGKPDLIVVDPPRDGMHPDVVRGILGLAPGRLVYVSCNPSTLARDTALLTAGGYRMTRAVPVDMFPQTAHVEVVAAFERS